MLTPKYKYEQLVLDQEALLRMRDNHIITPEVASAAIERLNLKVAESAYKWAAAFSDAFPKE